MFNNMPLLIKRFLDFINEEYEMVQKIREEAPKSKLKLPYHLEDHSILALADNPDNSKIFAELIVNGNTICLEYGDSTGTHDSCFNYHNFDNVNAMIHAAYTAWKDKVAELQLSDDDISVDEFAKGVN